jgi:hypothetical protein
MNDRLTMYRGASALSGASFRLQPIARQSLRGTHEATNVIQHQISLTGLALLRRRGSGFTRRQDPKHKTRHFFPRSERTRHLVADWFQALQECPDRHGIILRQMRKSVPRHDRRQCAAVRAHPGLDRGDDLLCGPTADAGFLVGRDVGPDQKPRGQESQSPRPIRRESATCQASRKK